MPTLPMPLRAAIGLAATVVEEARHFPDRAIELPMLAVSTALQMSLRAQQRYANLAARGDEVLSRRPLSDEPPPWATFDEPVAVDRLGDESLVDGAAAAAAVDGDGGTADTTRTRAPRKSPGKTVRKPRNGPPSAFDAVGDE